MNDPLLVLIFLSRGLGVEFSITTKGTGQSEPYKWGLWITQIKCDGSRFLEAPKGCFQYYMGSTGSFSSFNYENGAYLNNQVQVHTRGILEWLFKLSDIFKEYLFSQIFFQ